MDQQRLSLVGKSGNGTLNIEAGGQVSSNYGYLGLYSGSTGTATVTGTGSTWTNGGRLYVGTSGSGTLNVEAGGQVSNTDGYLGYNSGSTGTATVTGTGSTWTNSGDLYVGYSGSGTLTVSRWRNGHREDALRIVEQISWAMARFTTKGAVLDADLVFDATHGLQQTVAFGTGGTLNLNLDGSGASGCRLQGHRNAENRRRV